jgi:ribonuclease P protein component
VGLLPNCFTMSSHNSFCKRERLCNKRHIEKLFKEGKAFLIYPFRVVYLQPPDDDFVPGVHLQVLVSVSRKRIKAATGRNRIKRLVRESYRTNKHKLTNYLIEADKKLLLGLVYVGDSLTEFAYIELKINAVMRRLIDELSKIKK